MLANWSEILEKIFSYTLIHDGFVATVPIFYACMCAVISRQANIVNIAAEGIIMFGAFFGFAASYFTGSWICGVLAGMLIGVLVSWFMGKAYLNYKVNIFVVGLSVNMIAASGTRFLLNAIFGANGNFVSDKVQAIAKVNLGFLNKSPVLSSLFSGYAVTDLFIIPLVIAVWYMLYKTVWGLRLRSVGLNPMASMTAGIDVRKKQMQALLLSGACAGIGGAHLSLGYSCFFIEGMSGGKGFMGMVAMQFGNANPLAAGVGCVFFGMSQSVASRIAPWGIPNQFVSMFPYVATTLVLAITVIIQRMKRRREESALVGKKA